MKKILASAALLLCVFSTGLPTVHAEQPLDTVAVTGTARKMVAPDMATVTFSYETTGDTVEAVRASGAQMSTKVLAKLTALGISSADRATTRYTVAPTYTYEKNGRQKLTGYRLYSSWSAKVKNLNDLGTVVDGVLSTGVNRVESLSYGLQNESVYRRQLMTEAVTNARQSAQTIANAGGRGLGVLRQASVSESNFTLGASPRLLMMAKTASDSTAPETNIAPQPYKVSVTVNTVFAMTLE